MADGIAYDLDEDDAPFLSGARRAAWFMARADEILLDSSSIFAASKSIIPFFSQPGLYFLIWNQRICYVGKAAIIGDRLLAHQREGRPFERVSVLLGIPTWAQDEVEQAYIEAWQLPWNVERMRRGTLDKMLGFKEKAKLLDRACVMPRYFPALTGSQLVSLKEWQRQVIGYNRAHGLS